MGNMMIYSTLADKCLSRCVIHVQYKYTHTLPMRYSLEHLVHVSSLLDHTDTY